MFTKAVAKGLFLITALLLLITVGLSTRSVSAGEGTLSEKPAELLLFYSDGTVRSVSVDKGVCGSEADSLQDTVQSVVLDLGVVPVITDYNMGKIKKVKAGQRVFLFCDFNKLKSLGVSFHQLVGKQITIQFKLSGKIKYEWTSLNTIKSTDRYVIGIGTPYTVPPTTKTGKFSLTTQMTISGFEVKNNKATGRYTVIK